MLEQAFLERCNLPGATEQHFSKCGTTSISITQELVRNENSWHHPYLIWREAHSLVQLALELIPARADIGEALQRHAAQRWGQPGGLGSAACAPVMGRWDGH